MKHLNNFELLLFTSYIWSMNIINGEQTVIDISGNANKKNIYKDICYGHTITILLN